MKPPRPKTPRLKSPRLLPIVIFAAIALLGFKGIGLVANGGYVLSGTQAAHAAEGGASGDSAGGSVENAAPRTEPTMADNSPTLTDTSPTLVTKPETPAHGAAAAHGEGAAPAPDPGAEAAGEGAAPAASDAPAAKNDVVAAVEAVVAPATAQAGDTLCPPDAAVPPASANVTPATAAPGTPGINCDAVAKQVGGDGKPAPVTGDEGASPTEQTLLQRLGQRRAELDKREADLKVREGIVAAAEKQMQQRADALKALEAQMGEANTAQASADNTQFAGVIKMYQTMKPQEAAAIFDGLDMNVLFRVAKGMDPRKMSPILAKMAAPRAQELTTLLAGADAPAPAAMTTAAADPNALPQIVGH